MENYSSLSINIQGNMRIQNVLKYKSVVSKSLYVFQSKKIMSPISIENFTLYKTQDKFLISNKKISCPEVYLLPYGTSYISYNWNSRAKI